MPLLINGQLEIDAKRGVIYFHSATSGMTLLRICQLTELQTEENTLFPDFISFIDITHMHGASVQHKDN